MANFEIELIICLGFSGHIINYLQDISEISGREDHRTFRFHFGEGIALGYVFLILGIVSLKWGKPKIKGACVTHPLFWVSTRKLYNF